MPEKAREAFELSLQLDPDQQSLHARLAELGEVPPEEPDRPFRVFVLASPWGESRAVERVLKAADELDKQIERGNDWFVMAESEGEAEIVVDFKAVSRGESRVTRSGIGEEYHVFAEVTLFEERFGLRGTDASDHGTLRRAVSNFARELVRLCRLNYWRLSARRR